MALFGKKKDEAKKELRDIDQIKEMISPGGNLPSYQTGESQKTTEETSTEVSALQNTTEFSPQQLLAGNSPTVEVSRTSNVTSKDVMGISGMDIPKPATDLAAMEEKPVVTSVVEKNVVVEFPESVPLFIKLDRYKTIMHSISEMKSTVMKVKTALEMFGEMEKANIENLKVLETAVQKVWTGIDELDVEFQKPIGNMKLETQMSHQTQQEIVSVERVQSSQQYQQGYNDNLAAMIEELKVQIGKLKEELDEISPERQESLDDLDQIDS